MKTLPFSLALRYLLRRQRQTIVCLLGVAIGVAVFVTMLAMMDGFQVKFIHETVGATGYAIVYDHPRNRTSQFLQHVYGKKAMVVVADPKPQEKIYQIRNPGRVMHMLTSLRGVVAAAPTVDGNAVLIYGQRQRAVSVIGIQPRQQVRVTTIGRDLVAGSFARLRSTANGIVLGSGVAKELGATVNDTIIVTGPQGQRTVSRVVGIFSTGVTLTDYSTVYMLLRDAQVILDKQNLITNIAIKGTNPNSAPALAAQIEGITGYKTESWQEANQNFLTIFVIQHAITYIICAAILLVAVFGVFNILTMSVMEKTGDIAIMRSYGLTRADIRNTFVFQGLLIGVSGAGLGVVLAKIIVWAIKQLKFPVTGLVRAQGILMAERTSSYVIAAVAAVLFTLIAAVLPANRAAKFNPVDILRGRH